MKYIIFVGCCISATISAILLLAGLGSGYFARSDVEINLGVIASTGAFMLALSVMAALRQWNLRSADLVILPIVLIAVLLLGFTYAATHDTVIANWFGTAHIAAAIFGMWWLHRRNANRQTRQHESLE